MFDVLLSVAKGLILLHSTLVTLCSISNISSLAMDSSYLSMVLPQPTLDYTCSV